MTSRNDFAARLQQLIDLKKIDQRKFSKETGISETQISKWLNRVVKSPRRSTIVKIAYFFECNIDWLQTGKGYPYPQNEIKTAEKTLDFGTYKRASDIGKENEKARLLFFKQQCLGFFDELFEFVAEYYGPDKEGVDLFMDDLHKGFANYRDYIREKKAARKNLQTDEQDNLIANQK
ncbi:hypothetical protein DGMP_06350 [Desulfomarina profundi]|uniref:HTH cro/C1-type domain-containing protein n=2 Tax=Desulfomarina profundi TaxID=2772557 RepID=A0A8D5FU60_9BACT|nr:hypothetical protein DGMP_06350 [Desulfomarina profundi]